MIFFMIPISIMSVCTWPVDNNSICGNIVINNEYCDLHKLQDNTDTDTCIYDRKYYKEIAKLNNISAMRTIMKNVNEMKYMIVYILWYSTLDVVIWLIKEYNDAIMERLNNGLSMNQHTLLYSIIYNCNDINKFKYIYERFNTEQICRKNDRGYNLLHSIASNNNTDLFEYVYSKHPSFLQEKSTTGLTPINCAINGNHMNILKLMCSKINKTEIYMYLGYAINNSSSNEIIKYLKTCSELKCAVCRAMTSSIKIYLNEIQIDCPICKNNINANENSIIALVCGHVYCKECLDYMSA